MIEEEIELLVIVYNEQLLDGEPEMTITEMRIILGLMEA